MNIREMTKEQLAEESSIDIAYAVLAEKGENLTLRQLMDEVRKLNGVTVRAMAEKLPRINTDINIDGRFLSIDDIRWGLREWYPVDQLEVETAPVVRTRRKRKAVVDDDEDDIEDDEEIVDEDGFDLIDVDEEDDDDDVEDEDDLLEADEEEVEIDVDVDLLEDDEDEILPEDLIIDDEEEEEEEEE
ncbi:DNA-directed RNA polymerase subunit delta [Sporosarcina sp. Marseille-Q4063]|uniref:DNA-directed RNA polymerase subunit delta n=1 Tax=Sporosarcina sp. Marseille-Q4063 TaxID=2810514 RepID=UPI001BB00364|nr:DNA-directed RNA polymerase subunit delta [Sporosarcina sp. Marseille-Q4063]QUW21146.1 DNA-directed RNA polymerase subunit delta [Sporosarcina sp. Marseille-Q4063]